MAIEKKKREVHVKADKYYPPLAEQYQLRDETGADVSAVVYKAKCLATNETVAIKSIDLEKEDIDLVKVRKESQTLMLISHPNVLSAHCVFAANKCLWVVMPFMAEGSLHNILRTSYPNGLKEEVVAMVLKDVVNGLAYLHRAGHIHRDVKAGNILVDGDGTAKLVDFGACVSVFDSNKRKPSSLAGTILWMAPEVMFSRGYDFKADIWSFGITAMELTYGDTPFFGRKPHQIMEELENGIVPRLTSCKFSNSFRKVVGACVVMRPQKRPSAPCSNFQRTMFDPSKSPTFTYLSCASQPCQDLGISCNGNCILPQGYGDGSEVDELLSSDTVTLDSQSQVQPVQQFLFGCANAFRGITSDTPGLVSFGRDTTSFVSQTAKLYDPTFSYCLPLLQET